MSVGALIFAFDGDIEYTKLAQECAQRVTKYLRIPTTLVTDQVKTFAGFENQILVERPAKSTKRHWADSQTTTAWHNSGRSSAYDLSPYDTTLLLDADYLLASDCLSAILDSPGDFYAHDSRQYINEPLAKHETFGVFKTKMWWATVCVFKKTDFSRDVFEAWKMIENNYQHYADLFNFNRRPFRNDYCLSLALLLCNGNSHPDFKIPWALINVPDSCNIAINNDTVEMTYKVFENNSLKYKKINTTGQDLHIMCKNNLGKLI